VNELSEAEYDVQLLEELGSYAYDPLGFVMWAFPWGEAGTELEHFTGPDDWQRWVLTSIRDRILTTDEAIRIAVTSGHGVGKSALVAWLVWYAFSTFPDTRGVVTANTENQLKTKTFVEISKWGRLFIARKMFQITATAIFSRDESRAKEWRIDLVPWSEKNTEAFAGLHNTGKRILIIFDEASAIADAIWEVTEGALTDANTEIMWFAFGNPTRNQGRFRECFDSGKFAHRWLTRAVDSGTVKITNKKQIAQWVKDYGEDSDFCRVRIFGRFPREDAQSFISLEVCREAAERAAGPISHNHAPMVLGVDVARFGDDASVIYPRKGRDAQTYPPLIFRGLTTTQLTSHVMSAMDKYSASVCFVDGGGVGGGVVDQLRAMSVNVVEVQFGSSPDGMNPEDSGNKYQNKRAEIWGALRLWLQTGFIPKDDKGSEQSLIDELVAPTYTINAKDKIVLESKEMMKRRGAASPDMADALACTFAMPAQLFEEYTEVDSEPDIYEPYAMENIYPAPQV